MSPHPRPSVLRCLRHVGLVAMIAALSGLSMAQQAPMAPDGLRLDPPVIAVGEDGSYVARNDGAEIEKRSKDDPGLLWFRNGVSRRTEPGIDPAAPFPYVAK